MRAYEDEAKMLRSSASNGDSGEGDLESFSESSVDTWEWYVYFIL